MMTSLPVRILVTVLIGLVTAGQALAQTFASETFDFCYTGPLSCPDWAGDGDIEDLRGDQVLVFRTGSGQLPAATWHPNAVNVAAGRAYRISASVRTVDLQADVSFVARIQGDSETPDRFVAKAIRGTSSWQRVNLVFVPSMNGSLRLSIESASPAEGEPGAPPIPQSRILIDDILVTETPSTLSYTYFSNVCPDGQFADLAHSENDCRELHVSSDDLGLPERDILADHLHIDVDKVLSGRGPVGFDHSAPVSAYVARPDGADLVSECSGEAVQSAIDAAITGRIGVVRLPHCVIPIEEPIVIENAENLVVEGLGIGRTVLDRIRGRRPGPAIFVDRSRNVIIRDLSLSLHDLPYSNVQIERSDNILVERVSVSDAGSSAVRSQQSTRLTVRYSSFTRGAKAFSDTGCQGHWFASDQPSGNDRNRDGKGSTDECEMKWGADPEPGATWSAGYAAYSNIATETSFALHLTLAEVAGNRFIRSAGNKVADGAFVWIHDNEFDGDPPGGARIATLRTSRDGIVDRTPTHILFYHNRFVENEFVPIRIMERDVFAVNNEYVGASSVRSVDAKRILRMGAGSSICSGTTEHAMAQAGDLGKNPPQIVEMIPGGVCDLSRPGTFWSNTRVTSGQ